MRFFGAVVIAALTVTLSAFGADPFVGTWKPANLDKWKVSPGAREQIKAELLILESTGKDQYRRNFTTFDGKPSDNPPVTFLLDGKEHKSNSGVISKDERIDERHFRRTQSDSKGSYVADWVVSADGTTLTHTRKGNFPTNGQPVDELLIHEKQ